MIVHFYKTIKLFVRKNVFCLKIFRTCGKKLYFQNEVIQNSKKFSEKVFLNS